MKPHLLVLLFFAAPLIGRLFSGDSASGPEACDSAPTTAPADIHATPANTPDASPSSVAPATAPDTAPAGTRPSTPPSAPRKPASDRAAHSHAFTFM